jgi:hypothetical protein
MLDCVYVIDNGIGFTDREYARFKKLYDDTKGYNNKGSGRYRVLKFFNELKYESVYEEDTNFHKRIFDFSESHINTKLIQEISNEKTDITTTGTIAKLCGVKRKNNSQSMPIDNLSIDKIKDMFIKKYLLAFCLNSNITLSFIEYVNDVQTNTSIVRKSDIPEIDKTYDIDLPYYEIQNNEVLETKETEKFKIIIFKIDSSKLPENETFFVSKNILSDKSNIPFPLLGKTSTFDNSRFLLITSGAYFDDPSKSDDSRNFVFLDKSEYEKKLKKAQGEFFTEDKFILRNSFEQEYKNVVIKSYPTIEKKQQEKIDSIKKLKETFLIEDEDIKNLNFHLDSSEEEILNQIYEQDAKKLAKLDAKIMDNINKLDSIDSSNVNFETQFDSVVNDLTKSIPLANRNAISKYVARRKLTLEYFYKLLNGTLPIDIKEKHFHNLFLEQGIENNEKSNLWIADEEFIYFQGLSEKSFVKMKIDGKSIFKTEFEEEEAKYLNSLGENRLQKRPDILLFPSENKCIIIDFKDKNVNLSDHLGQITKYAALIHNYTTDDFHFDFFYGYLIGESFTNQEIRDTDSDFIESCNLDYMVRPKKDVVGHNGKRDGALYMEIIKYSTLLDRASNRNKIFIKKLGLDKTTKTEEINEVLDDSIEKQPKSV